jgi:hypothetical protein
MAVRIKNKQELERYRKSFYAPMTSKSNDEKKATSRHPRRVKRRTTVPSAVRSSAALHVGASGLSWPQGVNPALSPQH